MTKVQPDIQPTILSMPQLLARLGAVKRYGILKWIREGKFPKPLKPSGDMGHSYWRMADIVKWEAGEWKND